MLVSLPRALIYVEAVSLLVEVGKTSDAMYRGAGPFLRTPLEDVKCDAWLCFSVLRLVHEQYDTRSPEQPGRRGCFGCAVQVMCSSMFPRCAFR